MEYTIFDDYESWKDEKAYLLEKLVKSSSKIIARFSPVIIVVDYYNQRHKNKKLTKDEEFLFSTGFDYIYDQFETIESILSQYYDNDVVLMDKQSQTINLLLYVDDIINEFLDNNLKTDKLSELKNILFSYLESKSDAPDEYFRMLDEIIYDNLDEINTVDQIYYEVAIELNILKENDLDIYNEIILEKLNKTKKE